MTELTKAEDLILAAATQEIQLDAAAAGVVLGYMEGHDYVLMTDQSGQTKRHDHQDGANYERDESYSIREALLFSLDMGEELLETSENADDPNAEYIAALEKDCAILRAIIYGDEDICSPTQPPCEKGPEAVGEV